MNTQTLPIIGLSENIAYCEAQGLSNCFGAYAEHCAGETILDGGIGFNPSSGYVYIALENGIQLCSMLGREVEFLAIDFETGEENFFSTYHEAEDYLNKEAEA